MAFPTQTGNISYTSTVAASITKNWVAHVADDIAFLFATSVNRSVATPTGCTKLIEQGTGTAGAAGSTMLTIFAIRATSGAMPGIVVANPQAGDAFGVSMLQYRGIPRLLPLSSLVIVGDVEPTAQAAVTFPDPGPTSSDDSLILGAVSNATLTVAAQGSAYANANLANITERQDTNTNIGVGMGISNWTGELHIAGTVGTSTATLATASKQGRATLIIPSQSSVSSQFIAQVTEMLTFGPPYECDGVIYPSQPTLDVDTLVFTQTGPTINGITTGTVLRAVLPLAGMSTFRSKNAP